MRALRQLRRRREQAMKFGRMTGQDAAELGAVFVQVASRQVKDTAASAGERLGRSMRRARRSAGRGG
ncbi:MAG: hypothetical protein H0W96_05780 [Solirubrobacterales bacterium]|nr:hypothetical protein [Solirubrobacterales bacterium]